MKIPKNHECRMCHKHVPDVHFSMVRTGSHTGTLGTTCDTCAEKRRVHRNAVRHGEVPKKSYKQANGTLIETPLKDVTPVVLKPCRRCKRMLPPTAYSVITMGRGAGGIAASCDECRAGMAAYMKSYNERAERGEVAGRRSRPPKAAKGAPADAFMEKVASITADRLVQLILMGARQ